MPENDNPKLKPEIAPPAESLPPGPYAELHVTSNFSFLRGGSHPEELVAQAAAMGCRAVAITDINSLAGIVRAHVMAKNANIQFLVGCHLQLKNATGPLARGIPETPPLSLLVYPTDRAAYGRLSRLLTFGKRRAAKGHCDITLQDLLDHHEGLLAIAIPPLILTPEFTQTLHLLRETFTDDRLSLAATFRYNGQDERSLADLSFLSADSRIPLVATNDVHYHVPERQPLQDVLTCIRLGCTIEQGGFALFANAERHIKGPAEMLRLFADHPQAVHRTLAIAERAAGFSLDQLRYEYPSEVCPPGKTMMQHLIDRTWEGAAERYPAGVPPKVHQQILHEFALIEKLNYPAYFLTVDDIVRFARSKGILCQGRGAAANSAVCYCLGVTSVNPHEIDLLMERFISVERDEPPDIDIDFEHERREEVIQYLYNKYGRDRAALTAEVICYRRRSAVREVGKAMGLSLDCVDQLAKSGDWWEKGVMAEGRLHELGLDPHDLTLRRVIALATKLIGFPRHLSQHVGGFVISQGPLCESVPIENASMPDRTVIEWDKDDLDAMGMLKVDILGLGMLTCIRKAIELVNEQAQRHKGTKALRAEQEGGREAAPAPSLRALVPQCPSAFPLQFHTVPPEDPAVYDMLCKADSIGVFQVESRAEMTMLPRLRPRRFYDLVIEVAIVRPGPIQGGMVHPYLRRRQSLEPVEYPNDRIKAVLEKTLGVPLFQEQAMKMVIVAAGFTAGRADQLRRAMVSWKSKNHLIDKFGEEIIAGMLANKYTLAYAQRLVEQIKGFSSYGFPESHAASFALLVYVSSWLKCHHPAAFAAALLNSQPMGFYQPAQIIRDARDHGVRVRPVDVNYSGWDCRLEGGDGDRPVLRLGMRVIGGMRQMEAEKIDQAVQRHGKFESIARLWRVAHLRAATLKTLAGADAFTSMGLDRQRALWEIGKFRDDSLPMFESLEEHDEQDITLPAVAPLTRVVHDYAATGLSLKAHPLEFARPQLTHLGVTRAGELADESRWPHKTRVAVAGLVLVRQRPGTANGILFMTIEDETGVANLVVRPDVYEQFRIAIRHSVSLVAWGIVERQGQVVHVLVHSAKNLLEVTRKVESFASTARDFR